MAITPRRWFTILGDPKVHLADIQGYARSHACPEWTVHSQALPGDRVAFYLTARTSAIVATGTVASMPKLQTRKRAGWFGKHLAFIRDIRVVASPLTREGLMTRFPSWGWATQPRRSALVPSELVARFERELQTAARPRGRSRALSDMEGSLREVRTMQRYRSRRLRDLALAEAEGMCSGCQVDFSSIAGGIGLRVLQVHHTNPLAASRGSRPTRLKDLAVVCANCHLMLHAERDIVMSIAALRGRLATNS